MTKLIVAFRNLAKAPKKVYHIAVFLNRRALASIIPGRERPEENTVCYKISLVQLITNLNIILYLSTCHTVYISVLILFMIMTKLIINTYVSLVYELKKNWKGIYE
jgi:hypothetical protein